MKVLRDMNFPAERALYGAKDVKLINCSFAGEEDGESALKESHGVTLEDCFMDLRYPLWHDTDVVIKNVEMTEKCRAALWYTRGINISASKLHGIKALRECADIIIEDTDIVSPEFGWKCRGVDMKNCALQSEYLFLMSSDIVWKDVTFKGKYSFQYAHDVKIEDCVLDTKDAFWHAEHVYVRNCTVKGEYLAWYSNDVTFENCFIAGTQPFCCCTGLKLINCRTEGCDLSFEYSDVEADIKGDIVSVKNPRSGYINADTIGEVILTDDSVYPCECRIVRSSDNK
ncbi:MAG: DUF3737 family protein [Clostridia bacterium]|nr:DUF3737 family protein [Clostridia bacterium]